jgi:outer membrane protein insertion porin family
VFVLFVLGLMPMATSASQSQENLEGKIIQEIQLEGLKRTKEYIVTRELISKVGEPLRQENLDKDFNKLLSLDIFSKIEIERKATEGGAILIYRFTENFPVMILPAFKISDENGISVGGNIKTTNLLGRNIFLSGGAVFGGAKEFEIRLRELYATRSHFGYLLEYYHRERDNLVTNSVEKSNEFNLKLQWYLGQTGRIGGGFESLGIRSAEPGTTLDPDGHDRTARFSGFLVYDNRDRLTNTRRGWFSGVIFSFDSKLFNSYSNFYQVDLNIERFQPLPLGERHGLAFFSFASLRTGTVGDNVAPWQVYGIGGTNTVRGWEFAARKGKNQFINTLEYRYTLFNIRPVKLPFNINWRIGLGFALFGDLGIGWDTASQFRSNNFIGGVGAGVRILMPVLGMIRFDVGLGQPGHGIALHIGTLEKSEMTRKRVR